MKFDAAVQFNLTHWLSEEFDAETRASIQKMMHDHPTELIDAFYTNLSFGTAGMRGIMGMGSNRMNQYTIRAATQALANYMYTQPMPEQGYAVFIGYDSRTHSRFFAEEAAKVLAGNKIKAFICKELRPTPLVSFGCRYKHCTTAIMITASHNPPQYNGYKVYWSDGGQVLPPHDLGIIAEFNALKSNTQIKKVDDLKHPLIVWVGKEVDEAYLKAIEKLELYHPDNQQSGGDLKIVYTALHGTGITLMPEAFQRWGFTNIIYVPDQNTPDGHFPTVPKPNPEEPQALKLGVDTLVNHQADILIANDPDADRVGVAFNHHGTIHYLNGNQIACICLDHICKGLSRLGRLAPSAAFIKTIVTTELFRKIAESYGKPCFDVLTGFKYIAELIRTWELDPQGLQFVFGGEESYGYLFGTQTRDKDAITAGLILCEAALQAKKQNKTLLDLLYALYRKHGLYYEKVLSLNFEESRAGKESIAAGMQKLRQNPLKNLGGLPVTVFEDYQESARIDLVTNKKEKIVLPKSDVLLFKLEDGSKVIIRPSGTEPKIKIYCGVVENDLQLPMEQLMEKGEKRSQNLLEEVNSLLMTARPLQHK